MPDRLVAGTWAVAAVMTRGDITIQRARADHLEIALDKLVSTGATVDELADGVRVRCSDRPRAVDVVTLPYPGFPTDLQPQFIALNSIARGAAMVTENLFEARFRFVNEMVRLGADVRTDGHHAFVRGKERLSGAPVEAADIRAGAGLVLAGLVADGTTTVYEPHHVDRGCRRLRFGARRRIARCERSRRATTAEVAQRRAKTTTVGRNAGKRVDGAWPIVAERCFAHRRSEASIASLEQRGARVALLACASSSAARTAQRRRPSARHAHRPAGPRRCGPSHRPGSHSRRRTAP